ncbi:TetR/AcrR family transcriptional regulator [Kibdelosporangium banguiense]|uniref:TetR/AcrR family transcriptional regulator n=1 Tax=Kibdelosporangium banguiense TaxID=1365924 RepID=UPI001AE56144|nr:TetR/AcrR family transcriptional regulator [Kibdelosporangium banguiense]
MVVFAGQGDVRRTMALLWRTAGAPERVSPGPKPGLSADVIVDAAIALADAEGMAAVSMRTVGKQLGRTGMALYTYVPSKSELVDLMYDRVLAELPTGYDLSAGWRVAVTEWARTYWEFLLRHPWVLQVSSARPVLGPNEFATLETLVRLFDGIDVPAPVLKHIVGTLTSFVGGTARTVAESRLAPAATGMSEDDWWYARSAALTEAVPDFAERYPAAVRMEAESQTPHDNSMLYMEREALETFTAGLGFLLDGIETTIRKTA